MRVRVIGDKTGLDQDIRDTILQLEEASKDYTGLNFQIALNYGGQDEIVRAVRRIMEDTKNGSIEPADMTIERFAGYLDTKDIPEPDLMIRTSGEQRISNFLIWQLAYTELYFTPVPWPAFGKKELEEAVEAYNMRDRRFGLVKEE
jgi:undecaprenyl diphosphate synthase